MMSETCSAEQKLPWIRHQKTDTLEIVWIPASEAGWEYPDQPDIGVSIFRVMSVAAKTGQLSSEPGEKPEIRKLSEESP